MKAPWLKAGMKSDGPGFRPLPSSVASLSIKRLHILSLSLSSLLLLTYVMPNKRRKRHAKSALPDAEFEPDLAAVPLKRTSPLVSQDQDQAIHYEEEEDFYEDAGELNRNEGENSNEKWALNGQAPHYKYWAQRYRLFSKYHEGIILDDEGWFSVTPELIATHIAKRIWNSLMQPQIPLHSKKKRSKRKNIHSATHNNAGLLLDAFCGPGGNSIQFALAAPPGGVVFAIDIDPAKVEMARHNASIYGVQSRIEFVIGDSLSIAPRFRVDAVFLSPPWGGPDYIADDDYSMKSLLPVPGEDMHRTFNSISPNLAYLLPRNVIPQEVISLAEKHQTVELEGNYLTGKLKTVSAYFGALVTRPETSTPIEAHSLLDIDPLPEFIDRE